MPVPQSSHFDFNRGAIVTGPIQSLSPTPKSGNVFPKYPHAINETAWELWYFDGISNENETAILIAFSRHAEKNHGGFKVQVFGIWPGGKTWCRDIYFPESVIDTAEDTGAVTGMWRDITNGRKISFRVDVNCSHAEIDVLVPGLVRGSMNLTRTPGDTGLDTSTELGPSIHYMRPIGRAAVSAHLEFEDSKIANLRNTVAQDHHKDTPSSLHLGGGCSTGGMDRVWSLLSWPQIMSESLYVRANAGPYSMQVMRILPVRGTKNSPWTVARLYRDGILVCAPQRVIDAAGESDQHQPAVDSLVASKIYGDNGLVGTFRDRNTGYDINFIQGGGQGKTWCFHVRHAETFWNMPTSAPGPDSTGNTGFVEHVIGGFDGEQYHGVGLGGQCELS